MTTTGKPPGPIGPLSRAALQTFLDAAPDAFVVVDTTGNIVLANGLTEDMFGYSREDLIGQPIEILVPERFRTRHVEYRANYFREPRTRPMGAGMSLVGLKRDGTEFSVEISLSPMQTDETLIVLAAVRDISRRHAVEEFKFLVEGVEDYAIFLLDLAGRVTTWNIGAERINGYAPAEILGRHFSVFYTPEDVEGGKPEAELKAALERGRFEQEAWRVRKDGSRLWASVVINARRDDQGHVGRFAIITRDMSARRAAELELNAAVARTQAMMASALDCIISMDANGRVTEWNPAASRTFGYTRDEAIGRELAELIIPEWLREKHRTALAKYLRTGEGAILGKRVEMPAVTKDQRRITVELAITRIPVGPAPTFTGFLRDITAWKAAEIERRHQDAAKRLLDQSTVALASSLDFSATLEKAARAAVPELADWCLVDLANEAGELGQVASAHIDPRKEELARRLGRDLVPDLDLQHGAHHVFRTGISEIYPEVHDVQWTAQVLGTEYPELLRELGVVSYICVPIQFREKRMGVLNLLRAAPEKRYTASELEVAEELARRISMTIDNARLFRDAQDAIHARDEFLQIASHELRTPLTPLQMQLDLLIREFQEPGLENERLVTRLASATRQTARLVRLIDHLLDVSRITGGRLELDLEICDLSSLVRDVIERIQDEAKSAGSDLLVHAGDAVACRCDRLRVDQIVSNLLSNAIKYGSGKPVDVDVRADDDTVRVAITDHGIGMEEDVLERIFRPFERGVSIRHYGGLGLGLFIARQLAEAHGGTIVAQSQPGAGSAFTLVLPRAPREPGRTEGAAR
jgi:PAS domain S-box-containing protein